MWMFGNELDLIDPGPIESFKGAYFENSWEDRREDMPQNPVRQYKPDLSRAGKPPHPGPTLAAVLWIIVDNLLVGGLLYLLSLWVGPSRSRISRLTLAMAVATNVLGTIAFFSSNNLLAVFLFVLTWFFTITHLATTTGKRYRRYLFWVIAVAAAAELAVLVFRYLRELLRERDEPFGGLWDDLAEVWTVVGRSTVDKLRGAWALHRRLAVYLAHRLREALTHFRSALKQVWLFQWRRLRIFWTVFLFLGPGLAVEAVGDVTSGQLGNNTRILVRDHIAFFRLASAGLLVAMTSAGVLRLEPTRWCRDSLPRFRRAMRFLAPFFGAGVPRRLAYHMLGLELLYVALGPPAFKLAMILFVALGGYYWLLVTTAALLAWALSNPITALLWGSLAYGALKALHAYREEVLTAVVTVTSGVVRLMLENKKWVLVYLLVLPGVAGWGLGPHCSGLYQGVLPDCPGQFLP